MDVKPSIFEKQPYEWKTLSIDWTDALASGDSLSTYPCYIYDSAGAEQSSSMLGAPSVSSNVVSVLVKAGTAGQSYSLVNRVTTANGERMEADISILIKEVQYTYS